MSDHHAMESEGPMASNWVWSLAAAVVTAILARWLGSVPMSAAILGGIAVFVVYGALLAQFWEEPPHGPEDHGHDDHGHGHAHHGH